ncbi:hypothetical protein [Planococcus salinarum]|uniref:hypothetical protein n=1 Tax=Planococcus salinarum TaxID=622695 RepID=UPI000E3C9CFC|nr:hypothetical protein [Planococcus salinarum]TAA65832.1 hypothetical protein D2909_15855 [Planococcus salinarum]
MSLTIWKFIRAFAVALLAVGGFSFIFDGELPFSVPIMLTGLIALLISQYIIWNSDKSKYNKTT